MNNELFSSKSNGEVLHENNGDSIIPLEESEEMRILKESMKNMRSSRAYYDDSENNSLNLYAIIGLPFYIKCRSYNNGKQYITSRGKNKELYLNTLNKDSKANKFYIEKYSGSTGIDNIIYSMETGTPIILGYYTSNKNKSIVFPHSSNTLVYSADWSFKQASMDEYISITNNGSIKEITGGGPWGIYYESMGVGDSNSIVFGEYKANNPNQEFKIELIRGFTIDKIEFNNKYNNASIKKGSPVSIGGIYVNNGNTTDYYATVPITGNLIQYPSSYFRTKKQPIAYNLTNLNFSINKPLCINGKLYLNSNHNSKKSLVYNGYQYRDDLNINDAVNMVIPPKTIVEFKYYINKYELEIDYEVTASYNHNGDIRKIVLTGRWIGEIYSDDLNNIEITTTPIDNNNGGDFDIKNINNVRMFNIKENKNVNLLK